MLHYPDLHIELRNAIDGNTLEKGAAAVNSNPVIHPMADIIVAYIISACEALGEFHNQAGDFYLSKTKRSAYVRRSDKNERNGPGIVIAECAYIIDGWYGTAMAKDEDFYPMVNRMKAVLYKWRYELDYDRRDD